MSYSPRAEAVSNTTASLFFFSSPAVYGWEGRQGTRARFIGLRLPLELKHDWKPDESGWHFDLPDSPAVNGWARENKTPEPGHSCC